MATIKKPYHLTDLYKVGMSYREFMQDVFNLDYSDDPIIGNLELASSKHSVFLAMLPEIMNWREKGKIYKPIFQFWFKEYVDGLAEYLLTRYGNQQILEVGAGDGMLSHLLKGRGVNIVATDSGRWKISTDLIEKLTYKQAIKKYKPVVIIVSWMMLGEDWTPDFRRAKSVQEYIVIGEGEGGCCGQESVFHTHKGWRRYDAFGFDAFNICKTDELANPKGKWAVPGTFGMFNRLHSRTIAFRKIK